MDLGEGGGLGLEFVVLEVLVEDILLREEWGRVWDNDSFGLGCEHGAGGRGGKGRECGGAGAGPGAGVANCGRYRRDGGGGDKVSCFEFEVMALSWKELTGQIIFLSPISTSNEMASTH